MTGFYVELNGFLKVSLKVKQLNIVIWSWLNDLHNIETQQIYVDSRCTTFVVFTDNLTIWPSIKETLDLDQGHHTSKHTSSDVLLSGFNFCTTNNLYKQYFQP